MKLDRSFLLVAILCLAIGYWWASPSRPSPLPTDRPFLRFVAKVAKTFLWVAVVAEQPPHEGDVRMQSLAAEHIGEDGYTMVNHGRGW